LCGVRNSIQSLGKKWSYFARNRKRNETLVPSSFWKEKSSSVFTSNEDELRFVKRVTDFEQLGAKLRK
jgi:hypothetical protein